MAYRSSASKAYLNSEEFVVKSFNKDKMRLEQTDTNNEIKSRAEVHVPLQTNVRNDSAQGTGHDNS